MKTTVEKIIEDLIILRTNKGYSTVSLVIHIKKKYGLGETRAYELIKLAREKVGEFYYNTSENILEDALERLEIMYQKALKDGDNKLALSIQQELNKVHQLHIQKLDITSGGDKITININPNGVEGGEGI